MRKHTPGPWCHYTNPQPNGCPIIGAHGLMVAMLTHTINKDDEREIAISNARLIAAAPDLLEALERVMKNLCPLADGHTHEELVEYWESEMEAGRGEAVDQLFALATLKKVRR